MGRLPPMYRQAIKDVLRSLPQNPFPAGCLQLRTAEGRYYRVRVGSYRIVYEVTHEIRIITIIRVGHRREVYRNL